MNRSALRFCASLNSFTSPSGHRAGINKPRRATIYTVHKKGGFSLDFQAFSQFDNTCYKMGYFSGIIELHNKKG